MGSNASCQDVRILKGIFAVEEFDGVAADTDVRDFVSLFSGVGEDVAGALHFDALFDVDGSCGRRQTVADEPGGGTSGRRSGGGILAARSVREKGA
jgi:hypothetical protein